MTRIILSILLLSSLAFSCKKKNTETPVEEPKDEIVQQNFNPAISLQSVRSYSSISEPCPYIAPFPSDSSVAYKLDVNSDNVPDFEFNVSHHLYTGTAYCGHCPVYEYYVTVKALASENGIAANSQGVKFFKETETVDNNYTWINLAPISIKACVGGIPSKDGYLGIKVGDKLGYINIKKFDNYNNGLQILNVGFNKTAGRSIACVQK